MRLRWTLRILLLWLLVLLLVSWSVSYYRGFSLGFGGNRPFVVPRICLFGAEGRLFIIVDEEPAASAETLNFFAETFSMDDPYAADPKRGWHPHWFFGMGWGTETGYDPALVGVKYTDYILFVPYWMPTAALTLALLYLWRRGKARSGPSFPVEANDLENAPGMVSPR